MLARYSCETDRFTHSRQVQDGNTPLHYAVTHGHVDLCKALLDDRKPRLAQKDS